MEDAIICYVLRIKGFWYDAQGEITHDFLEAKLFASPGEANRFRRIHDPRHRIDQAQLLRVSIFTEIVEGKDD